MADGALRATIANEMVRLHSEYYGRGPTKAKVYANGFEEAGRNPPADD